MITNHFKTFQKTQSAATKALWWLQPPFPSFLHPPCASCPHAAYNSELIWFIFWNYLGQSFTYRFAYTEVWRIFKSKVHVVHSSLPQKCWHYSMHCAAPESFCLSVGTNLNLNQSIKAQSYTYLVSIDTKDIFKSQPEKCIFSWSGINAVCFWLKFKLLYCHFLTPPTLCAASFDRKGF